MTPPYMPGMMTGQQAFQQGGMPGPAPQYTQQQYAQPMMQPPYPGFAPQQQQMQQPMQMPHMPQGVDLNARMPNDPSIPQELRGRTWGEAIRYYSIMREDFISRNQQQRQQQQQQQQQQFPQNQGVGPGQQQGQPHWSQRQSAQPNFGQQQQQQQIDPIENTVRNVLNEVLPQALEPVTRPMQQQQLMATYNTIKSRYQDWPQFEAEIIGSMQGADAATLQNPSAWEAAYFHAKGKAFTQRQLPAGQQQQQMQQGPQYGPPMGAPMQQIPVVAVPQQGYQQPFGNSFIEGPTPAATGMHQQQQDPRDEVFARRFNVPLDVYRSWKGGRIGLVPQAPQQQMQQPQMQMQQQMPQYQGMMPQQQFGQPQYSQVPGFQQMPNMNGGNGYAP